MLCIHVFYVFHEFHAAVVIHPIFGRWGDPLTYTFVIKSLNQSCPLTRFAGALPEGEPPSKVGMKASPFGGGVTP